MARKSTFKQEMFAREWVIDQNGTRAAIAAGYKEKAAHVAASQLLSNPKVQRIIQQLQAKRASKLQITAEKIDEEVAKLAFSNMGTYVRIDENGKPVGIDLANITSEQWAAVQEIREDTTGGTGDGERKIVLRTTLKLSDKTKNLELLCRRLGLLQDKLAITGIDGLADKMSMIRKAKHEATGS